MPTLSPPAATAKSGAAPAAPLIANRFLVASKEHSEPFYDNTVAMPAAGSTTLAVEVPAYGYLRFVDFVVTLTTSANAATVALKEDAPFSTFAEVALTDVNGAYVAGPFDGFDLFCINKYGGYVFDADPTHSPAYTQLTTGSGATAGSGGFFVRIPIEIVSRDAFGALPNMNSAATYKLRLVINNTGNVYSTAPTTPPNVRVKAFIEAWMQPPAADEWGRPNQQVPPFAGTSQFWTKQVYTVNNGANTLKLQRVGNIIRTFLLVFRNATPVRNDTSFLDPIQVNLDGVPLYNHAQVLQKHFQQERYGYVLGLFDTGVYAYTFDHEFDGHPGGELRDLYLPTNSASRLELVGVTSAAGTLNVLTNDLAPVGDIFS